MLTALCALLLPPPQLSPSSPSPSSLPSSTFLPTRDTAAGPPRAVTHGVIMIFFVAMPLERARDFVERQHRHVPRPPAASCRPSTLAASSSPGISTCQGASS